MTKHDYNTIFEQNKCSSEIKNARKKFRDITSRLLQTPRNHTIHESCFQVDYSIFQSNLGDPPSVADRLWHHLSPSCVHRFFRSKIFWVVKSSKLVTWFLSSKSTSAISMNHLLKDICSRFRYPLWAARWWGRDHATDFLSMQKCLKVIVLRFPTLRHHTHHRNRLHPDPQTGRSGWFDGLSIWSIMRGCVFIAIERFTKHFCM